MQCSWEVTVTRLDGKQELKRTVQNTQPVKGDVVEKCAFIGGEIIPKMRIIESGHWEKPKGGTSMGAWTDVTAEELP